MNTQYSPTDTDSNTQGRHWRFHLAIWRWHFYAGLFVLPLTIILAVSGLAMLAGEPLDRRLHADLFTTAGTGAHQSPTAQAAAVTQTYPHWDIATLRFESSARSSTRFDLTPPGASAGPGGHGAQEALTVFVDPTTATVLGEFNADQTVYAWAKKLHGTLLLGTVGDYVIEIAAGFGVLLIVTGLYLWWPRQGRTLRSALLPALNTGGRRRWRDLHGAVGAWMSLFLLFFFVSGLAWTPVWGGKLVQAWSSLPGERLAAPLSAATHADLNHDVHHHVPWALEQTPLPASSAGAGAGAGSASVGIAHAFSLDDVVDYARVAGFETFRVHWPRGEDGVWTIASTTIAGDTRRLGGDRIVHMDTTTGAVIAEIGFADYSPMGKFMAAGIPLHEGATGPVNMIINILLCIAVIGMGAAAIAAWWARRPAGVWRIVPPPLPRDAGVWRGAVIVMFALSFAFPLAAATIAVVLALDLLLSRALPG
jgi:uncharacterized iron-regulated membrane protein